MEVKTDQGRPRTDEANDLRYRLRHFSRVIWRGRALVLACLLLGLGPTFLYLSQVKPTYTADVKLVIEGAEAVDMSTRDRMAAMGGILRMSDTVVQTESEILSSTLLLGRLVDRYRLDQDPEFNVRLQQPKALEQFIAWINPLSWLSFVESSEVDKISPTGQANIERARVINRLSTKIKISFQRRSNAVTASFSSEQREKAAMLANSLAELYVNERLEESFEETRRVTGWLGERLEGLRKDVVSAESAAETYRAQNNLRRKSGTPGDHQGSVTDQQLSELNSRLIIARTELAQKQARQQQMRELIRSQGTESASDVLGSQLIQHLREQEAGLQQTISEQAKIYGDRHPKIVGARAELAELQSKITAEIGKINGALANEVDVAQTGVRTLEAELEGLKRESNMAGGAEIKLRELERQAEVNRSLYETFLSRFKRDIDQEQVERANARVISPASVPLRPSAPRKTALIGMVSLLFLGLGVGLVLLLDHLDNGVRSTDEAEDLSGLSLLSLIPLHRQSVENIPRELAEHPRSPLADAVRSLRVTLDLGEEPSPTSSGRSKAQVVMVTSSVPKEGKTFLSLCLAATLARVEGRVLLIDGDLHRPKLHDALKLPGQIGLAQVLGGLASLEDAVQKDVAQGLDFLPAGLLGKVADLVTDEALTRALGELRHHYDRIIVDLPPVLAVSDPRIFARLADRVLYLIKWNGTPRDAVRSGLKLLREADAPLYGIVLSQVDQRKYNRYAEGDYGNYYGRYKEYYADPG